MELKYKGREISIQTKKDASGQWDWSYGIRGHGHRHNAGASLLRKRSRLITHMWPRNERLTKPRQATRTTSPS
ncbi:hypothetical protein D3C72_2118650 [compost metagenome]